MLTMNTTLLEADNLTATGYYYGPKAIANGGEEVIVHAVHITFNILVNGRIKIFSWSFFIENEHGEWNLQDYTEWNVVYSIITQLGYNFGKEESYGQGEIKQWINKIMV